MTPEQRRARREDRAVDRGLESIGRRRLDEQRGTLGRGMTKGAWLALLAEALDGPAVEARDFRLYLEDLVRRAQAKPEVATPPSDAFVPLTAIRHAIREELAQRDQDLALAARHIAEFQVRAAAKKFLASTPRARARYEVVSDCPDRLVIRDLGPWDLHPTVTNDAENVVSELVARLGKRRLFYHDSEGVLDELRVVDGRFAGFAPGRCSTCRAPAPRGERCTQGRCRKCCETVKPVCGHE